MNNESAKYSSTLDADHAAIDAYLTAKGWTTLGNSKSALTRRYEFVDGYGEIHLLALPLVGGFGDAESLLQIVAKHISKIEERAEIAILKDIVGRKPKPSTFLTTSYTEVPPAESAVDRATDLESLAQRCEVATGASREIDRIVARLAGWPNYLTEPPAFTASYDDVMRLFPNGIAMKLSFVITSQEAIQRVELSDGISSQGFTPVLALCASALRLMAARR